MKDIILASASPRRKELLEKAGITFDTVTADFDEALPENILPCDAVMLLANGKAAAVAESYNDKIVIGSDTVVAYNGEILGKPKNHEDAKRMLQLLSGKTHSVFTGVCIICGDKKDAFYTETKVTFYDLSQQEIAEYVSTNEPMDKAGAYGIQGKGCLLVKKIEGDYFTVVGLPVAQTVRRIKKYL